MDGTPPPGGFLSRLGAQACPEVGLSETTRSGFFGALQADPSGECRVGPCGRTVCAPPAARRQATVLHSITWIALRIAATLALCCGAASGVQAADRSNKRADAPAAGNDELVVLPIHIVSATRIEKRPWRYAALPGFEVLSRASDDATNWWLDALRRGRWLEDHVLPKDWLSPAPAPYTVIIDDTNFDTVRGGPLHSPPVQFRPPADALTWGQLSGKASVWAGRSEAHDDDTFATNVNVYDVDTGAVTYSTVSLERLSRCAPALPRWVMSGLLGSRCGLFRQSFMLMIDEGGGMPRLDNRQGGSIHGAVGPGTLWVSLEETPRLLRQLKNDKEARIAMLPLRELFAEALPAKESVALWESEAALFARWGLMGPGRRDAALSRAFLDLVRRARHEPITEQVFTDCFGFNYAVMEGKLEAYLKTVLAQPNAIDVDIPSNFPEADLRVATADQIGRILGDWLRMQGASLRKKDATLSAELLDTAEQMLLRAYKQDNGLPPDAVPAAPAGRPARPARKPAAGPVVVLEEFVVTAARLHDPGLLAVYGLYEHDRGDDARAREFLEKAVQGGAMRPRAGVVLAELRYAEAAAKPLGREGKFSAEQVAAILAPLRIACQSPATLDLYRLYVSTWEHSDFRPAASDIGSMAEGVACFPRQSALALRAALVCAQSGYPVQAADWVEQALIFAGEDHRGDYREQLRKALRPVAGGSLGGTE